MKRGFKQFNKSQYRQRLFQNLKEPVLRKKNLSNQEDQQLWNNHRICKEVYQALTIRGNVQIMQYPKLTNIATQIICLKIDQQKNQYSLQQKIEKLRVKFSPNNLSQAEKLQQKANEFKEYRVMSIILELQWNLSLAQSKINLQPCLIKPVLNQYSQSILATPALNDSCIQG
eukprot:403377111